MSEMKGEGGKDGDDRPPHHGSVGGLCSRCGAEYKGAAYEFRSIIYDDDDDACCPQHPGFVNGFCSRGAAEEEDTEGSALGDIAGREVMNQAGAPDDAANFLSGFICSKCAAADEAGRSSSTLAAGNIYWAPAMLTSAPPTNVPRAPDRATLLRTKKLVLILDLDHTLLNSTRIDEFSAIEQEKGFTANLWADPRRGLFDVNPYGIPLVMKLRPFAGQFLKQASAMFQMYVYTSLDLEGQGYAREVVKLLDPDCLYLENRILSIQKCNRREPIISGADDSTVVILDDTYAAWPEHEDNLILMNRYHYFSSSCRNTNCRINSLAELG
ncbi:hypothetical protein U9M48_021610 [Paspalum notatum var. saurae]|uniref:protein-serine/threonine phosphatase n=1 Tax=Paspalum notatum var. saurae TaxID=547442 RepID=A0AAQ3TK08_PASNO